MHVVTIIIESVKNKGLCLSLCYHLSLSAEYRIRPWFFISDIFYLPRGSVNVEVVFPLKNVSFTYYTS